MTTTALRSLSPLSLSNAVNTPYPIHQGSLRSRVGGEKSRGSGEKGGEEGGDDGGKRLRPWAVALVFNKGFNLIWISNKPNSTLGISLKSNNKETGLSFVYSQPPCPVN